MLWPARIGLIVLVVLHIVAAVQLSAENKRARAVPYQHYEVVAASYASRTMMMSGLIIAAFVVYHLLHFTVQVPGINFTGKDFRILEDAKARHERIARITSGERRLQRSASPKARKSAWRDGETRRERADCSAWAR